MGGIAAWPPSGMVTRPISELVHRGRRAASARPAVLSARWLESLEQLAALRSALIRIDPLGSYGGAAYIKARSFVVLAHAVLEDYVEGICVEVVDGAIKSFETDGRPRTALMALLRYAAGGDVPHSYVGGPWGLRASLNDSRQVLHAWTRQNNGIKQKDVLRLLLPTGLKESDMGPLWLAAMDALGELRGRVAHRGLPPGAVTPVDPKDALDQVEAVLGTLSRIDSKLVALRDE